MSSKSKAGSKGSKGRSYYMHTLDGKPAYYSKSNGQIVFMCSRTSEKGVLVESLSQIRAQRKANDKQRRAWGISVDYFDYGYVVFAR